MPKVTQADIAQALNLSPTTVGLVVGNTDSPLRNRLSKETIRRIQEKAEEMGYFPNRAAQMMRRGRSNMILLLNMSGHSEIGARSAYQIGRLVHQAGFEFQTIEAYWWPGEGSRFIDQVLALRPEGLIVIGSVQTEMDFSRIIQARIPLASIACPIPGVPTIRHGAEEAFRQLTAHALSLGEKRVALVLKEVGENFSKAQERVQGFSSALKDAGWPAPKTYHLGEELPQKSGGRQAFVLVEGKRGGPFTPFSGGERIAQWVGNRISTLICSNDHYAFGVMTHYLQNGFEIPTQVKVSGYDNLSFTTQGIAPLTTVEQPTEIMCDAAMELVLNRIHARKTVWNDQIYPSRIIWRQSMPGPASVKPEPPLITP